MLSDIKLSLQLIKSNSFLNPPSSLAGLPTPYPKNMSSAVDSVLYPEQSSSHQSQHEFLPIYISVTTQSDKYSLEYDREWQDVYIEWTTHRRECTGGLICSRTTCGTRCAILPYLRDLQMGPWPMIHATVNEWCPVSHIDLEEFLESQLVQIL